MFKFKFEKNRNYLVACSFAADSMALLDGLVAKGILPVVCYVDYHNAPSAVDDMRNLGTYCASKGIILEILDTAALPQCKEGEFPEWSRRARYDFFLEMYAKYDAASIFIPHTEDDMIETYLTQKKTGGKIKRYGLNPISTFEGMIVVRPMLGFSDQDLLSYVREKKIPFSEEMTNFEYEHTHNEFRQEVNKLNEVERGQIVDEIKAANDDKLKFFGDLEKIASESDELNIREIIALDKDEFAETLIHFVNNSEESVSLKDKDIKEIRKMCLSGQPNASYFLKGETCLIKEYDTLILGHDPLNLPYCYVMEKPGVLKTSHFEVDFSMGAEDRNIKGEDYPISIRTALPADQYILSDYLYSVRSLYSDWKMPMRLREIWPVIANSNGKVVYVPRYRRDFVEYHSSLLKINVKEDEK